MNGGQWSDDCFLSATIYDIDEALTAERCNETRFVGALSEVGRKLARARLIADKATRVSVPIPW